MNYMNALKILGLQPNFTEEDLKKAYRRLAKQHHPDISKDGGKMFKLVKEANEFLKTNKGQPIPTATRTNSQRV